MAEIHSNMAVVLEEYLATDLGAPFDVTLINSVRVFNNKNNGMQEIQIPNLRGLLQEIALTRALHSRKLSGAEIKFIRKAMPIKSQDLASFIGVSPEHLSRCEAGEKFLSGSSEKLVRLNILSHHSRYAKMMSYFEDSKKDKLLNMDSTHLEQFLSIFSRITKMKIVSVFDPSDRLAFKFNLEKKPSEHRANNDNLDDSSDWMSRKLAA